MTTTSGANAPAPTRLEWRRDGYTVWADEDGVHIAVTGGGFEMPEAIALVELYQSVLSRWRNEESFSRPERPTRAQLYTYPETYVAARLKRAVDEAIRDEFANVDKPF